MSSQKSKASSEPSRWRKRYKQKRSTGGRVFLESTSASVGSRESCSGFSVIFMDDDGEILEMHTFQRWKLNNFYKLLINDRIYLVFCYYLYLWVFLPFLLHNDEMSAFSKALPTAIKEIRLIGCQTGNRSEGLRCVFSFL